MTRTKIAPYRSSWVKRAETALVVALSSETGVPNSPFRFGEDLRVPLDRLREVIAGLAKTHRWALYGPDSPANPTELKTVLQKAGKRCERLVRTKYRGKIKTGQFAIGIDVDDDPADDDDLDVPSSSASSDGGASDTSNKRKGRGVGRYTGASSCSLMTTMAVCSCGFEPSNDTASRRHAVTCDGTIEKRRVRLSATAPEGGAVTGGIVQLRAYSCANDKCKAHDVDKLWLSRQAAHQHGKLRGCLVTSERRDFYRVG